MIFSLNDVFMNRDCLMITSCWLLLWLTSLPWKYRQYGPPKHHWTSTRLYSVTAHKTLLFIITSVRTSYLMMIVGRAVAQGVSRWFSTAAARVRTRSGHMGFVVDKETLGQIFSEYFGLYMYIMRSPYTLYPPPPTISVFYAVSVL
jgi:hypothetical protein